MPRLSIAWLGLPAALHLAVTFTVFLAGRLRLLPWLFDGDGVATSFAPDGIRYNREAAELARALARGGVAAWVNAAPPLHVKFYSLPYLALGPAVGFNVVAAEPINGLCYVATVWLVYRLGRGVFSQQSGILAAAAISVWPSFLLHSTQLLKDPLLVASWMVFIFVLSCWLTRELQWNQGLAGGVLAALACLVIRNVREDMWVFVLASSTLGLALLALRQFRARRLRTGNSLGAALLLLCVAGTSAAPQVVRQPSAPPVGVTVPCRPGRLSRLISERRRISIVTGVEQAGSNIDTGVFFDGTTDIIRHIPRAAEIGFFAPFPNMWFVRGGQMVAGARVLGGAETTAMYAVEALALLTLWRRRRRLVVWLLILTAMAGMLALGLVVVNVGTLYRFRYSFLILLIIAAADSVMIGIWHARRYRRHSGHAGVAPQA